MEAKTSGLSVVEFPTHTRIHVALRVSDLDKSKAFYAILFGQEPTKVRPGYAKFEVLDPPVNLTMNEDPRPLPTPGLGNVSHLGIQVKSTESVGAAWTRLKQAGLLLRTEEQVSCCYALQDKVWATDPDGNEWEVFVVLNNDSPDLMPVQHAISGTVLPMSASGNPCCVIPAEPAASCCAPGSPKEAPR